MPAAVAVIIASAPDPAVLLIQRPQHVGDPWAGHWALPGGRRQAGDVDDLATCIRETAEEVGIILERPALSRVLPVAQAGRHMGAAVAVAPFVFIMPAVPQLVVSPREVARTWWLPLSDLHDLRRHAWATLGQDNQRRPMILVDDHPLWGFTYHVLCAYAAVLPPQA